jgi:alpha-D-ribose 1-methylphosphonate 5-triphosphate synthase subunit PhnH
MHTNRNPGNGFADPVFDAQAAFRELLDAMSRPGEIRNLARPGFVAPAGLPLAAAACLLTLTDHETPVWMEGGARHPAAHWLAFHAGASAISNPAAAAFAVIDGAAAGPLLCDFPAGDDRYPDRSATLIMLCESLEGGADVQLRGPGIRETAIIAPRGLRVGFWDEVHANGARFPLGVDIILAAGTHIICLPRTIWLTAEPHCGRTGNSRATEMQEVH